jgi:uncharacterized membrane protein
VTVFVIIRRTLWSPIRRGPEEEPVFSEFMGLPLHPLVVHAAVVFVPLLVVTAVVYAFVPRWRRQVGWLALVLAVAAPLVALVAKLSGGELQETFIAKNYPPQILDRVAEHSGYGDRTFWFSLVLGLFTVALVVVTSRRPQSDVLPSWVRLVLTAGVVVFAVLTGVYVYLTGESGAQAVWSGTL